MLILDIDINFHSKTHERLKRTLFNLTLQDTNFPGTSLSQATTITLQNRNDRLTKTYLSGGWDR